ncbi:MAG: aldehyde dehydrogenase family protein [Planctomycetes bacterium]|nr:aldehyde dehydrogenase family protein [Planctomycetota bacterium]
MTDASPRVPHLPLLRLGAPYESLDTHEVRDHATGTVLALVSQANAGLIRRDLARLPAARAALRAFGAARRLAACARAAELFRDATLPLDANGPGQSPDDYVRALSATSGLPHTLCRRNALKLHDALAGMEEILRGLTRGLDLALLDSGSGRLGATPLSFFPVTDALGVVLPSNSPGVNSLWLPALALGIPVLLKPGREEPWTPWRLAQALLAAGFPPEAIGLYPAGHDGAEALLGGCGRALLFGDEKTTARYAANPAIEIHGPGRSKVLIGADEIGRWPEYLDLLTASVAENGGRSCVNASAIVVPAHADEIADALARRLAALRPLPADHPQAELAACADPRVADAIEAAIEAGLRTPGAADITARYRPGPRRVTAHGGAWLLPTVLRCDTLAHPLANVEYPFPFCSVVELPAARMLAEIGPSLVVTAITRDPGCRDALLRAPGIQRLNLGPVPTPRVRWDQPHEGNLFEFLFRRRALAAAPGWEGGGVSGSARD